MLEELQRLQAHIAALKAQVEHYEQQNQLLYSTQTDQAERYQAEIEQKNATISHKQQEIER